MVFLVVEELDPSDFDPADVQPIEPQRLHIVLVVFVLLRIGLLVFLVLRHVVFELYLEIVDDHSSESADVETELGHYLFYLSR